MLDAAVEHLGGSLWAFPTAWRGEGRAKVGTG